MNCNPFKNITATAASESKDSSSSRAQNESTMNMIDFPGASEKSAASVGVNVNVNANVNCFAGGAMQYGTSSQAAGAEVPVPCEPIPLKNSSTIKQSLNPINLLTASEANMSRIFDRQRTPQTQAFSSSDDSSSMLLNTLMGNKNTLLPTHFSRSSSSNLTSSSSTTTTTSSTPSNVVSSSDDSSSSFQVQEPSQHQSQHHPSLWLLQQQQALLQLQQEQQQQQQQQQQQFERNQMLLSSLQYQPLDEHFNHNNPAQMNNSLNNLNMMMMVNASNNNNQEGFLFNGMNGGAGSLTLNNDHQPAMENAHHDIMNHHHHLTMQSDTSIVGSADRRSSATSNGNFSSSGAGRTKSRSKRSSPAPARDDHWYNMLEQLKQYKSKYGDTLVSNSFKENAPLAQWVKRQRYQFKLKSENAHSTLSDEREQALREVGFVFDSHEAIWEERFNQLIRFRETQGHVRVPTRYPANPQLSIWVKCQRRQFKLFLSGKKSYMTMDRIRKLSSVGFVFNPRKLAGSMELTLAELQEMEVMVERQRQGAAQGQQSNQYSSFPTKDQEETDFHEA